MTLLFRVTNYQAVMVKFDFMNYGKLRAFSLHLPEVQKEQFQAIVSKGQLVARTVLDSIGHSRYSSPFGLHGCGNEAGLPGYTFQGCPKRCIQKLRISCLKGPSCYLKNPLCLSPHPEGFPCHIVLPGNLYCGTKEKEYGSQPLNRSLPNTHHHNAIMSHSRRGPGYKSWSCQHQNP